MPRTGLEVPCPNCRKELSIEGGVAPGVLRESMRLRAAEAEVEIICATCGSEVVLGPPSGSGKAARPVKRLRPEELLRQSAERSARILRDL